MESIKNTLAELTDHFNTRMADFQKELKTSIPAASPTSNINSQFNSFRLFVLSALENLQLQVELLTRQQDQLEMRTRRKMLLVHGVPEAKKENTSACVSALLSDRLKIPEVSEDSVRYSYRLGRPNTDKPRAIVVKFRDVTLRDKVWYSKKTLKGTDITLSEFLTKGRHELFLSARRRFGVSRCWTKEGAVIVLGSNGSRHRINSMSELNSIPNSTDTTTSSAATVITETTKDTKTTGLRSKRVIKK